ncbi:fungal cellulose binding domain-containing protein [Mycena sanguinolenta]|nr:fungal cellulose binding domain-containing protein [Mycena sanguinolenta]
MLSLRALPLIVSLVVSSVTAGITEPPCDEPKVAYWFSFGDSYTTTGFTWNSTLPSIGNPLGNPAFPGDTGGGGENYVGFDTVTYNKSLILSYDYGVGGAVIDPTLVAPLTLALPDEVTQFLEGAAKKPKTSPWTSEDALFSVWIGINDLGNTFYLNGSRSAFADLLLERYFAQVQQLCVSLDVGGRNFLFINVPPTYRAPLIIGFYPTQLNLLKTVIEGFNSKLTAKVKAFQAQNHGVTTWVWDAYTAFNIVLDSPQKYGFVDNSSYGEPGDFWG